MKSLNTLVGESIELLYEENSSPANFEVETIDLTTEVLKTLEIFHKKQIKDCIKEICETDINLSEKIKELDPSYALKAA